MANYPIQNPTYGGGGMPPTRNQPPPNIAQPFYPPEMAKGGGSNPNFGGGGGMPPQPDRSGMDINLQPSEWSNTGTTYPPEQNPLSPWNPVMPPQYNNPGMPGMPPISNPTGGTNSGLSFGGQRTTGASAGPADYAGVQGFSDAAYENSRRYLDPMQDQQNRRLDQELINKGVDPRSEMGMAMADEIARGQSDQNNSAMFSAMGFGQDIQNQMFGQDFMNTQQGGNMAVADWANQNRAADRSLSQYGMDQGYNVAQGNLGLGYENVALNRYGMDQNFNMGRGMLDLNRQKQDFNEYMGYEGVDYRNDMFNEGNVRWDQGLAMQLAGMGNPFAGGTDPRAAGQGGYGDYSQAFDDYRSNRGG